MLALPFCSVTLLLYSFGERLITEMINCRAGLHGSLGGEKEVSFNLFIYFFFNSNEFYITCYITDSWNWQCQKSGPDPTSHWNRWEFCHWWNSWASNLQEFIYSTNLAAASAYLYWLYSCPIRFAALAALPYNNRVIHLGHVLTKS